MPLYLSPSHTFGSPFNYLIKSVILCHFPPRYIYKRDSKKSNNFLFNILSWVLWIPHFNKNTNPEESHVMCVRKYKKKKIYIGRFLDIELEGRCEMRFRLTLLHTLIGVAKDPLITSPRSQFWCHFTTCMEILIWMIIIQYILTKDY